MALVNGGFLHHEEILKKSSLKLLVKFEIISQNVTLVTLLKTCARNFGTSLKMDLVNGSYLHYTDMKKFLKNSSSQKTGKGKG